MHHWQIKALTEVNILRAMTTATEELGKITDEAAWKKIAQLHSSDAVIDERSISLIKRQNPALTEQEFAGLLQKFQGLDSARYRAQRIPVALKAVHVAWQKIRFATTWKS